MRLITALLLIGCLQVSANGWSQDRITLKMNEAELKKVLLAIEKKSDYRFLFSEEAVKGKPRVSLNVVEATVNEVLDKVLANTGIAYKILGTNLVVLKEGSSAETITQQEVRVSGKVTASTGEALSGVSVTVKGSRTGTSTDASGNYSLTVPDDAVLVFSSVGFDTQEITVGGQTTVDVVLVRSEKIQDAVVVIGYGTARKRDLTGAVATVKGAELAKQPVQTPTQALQGKVAGVQVIASGQPNSSPKLRIRGIGSTLAGVEPLYVVDGVITEDIRNINNNDIVSMDILKDASATAIYGMRAANGVVLITTKKGRKGKMQFAYDMNIGVREATKLVNMAGENQYAGYVNEANVYYGSGDSVVRAADLKGYNTDWYDAILRRGLQQNHNVSVGGGNDNITYFLSAGYLTDQGVQRGNDFNRFTLRSNNEYTLSKKLKLSTLISYTTSDDDGFNAGAFQSAYRATPIVPAKLNGKYGNTSAAANVANPLLSMESSDNRYKSDRIQGNGVLEYKPFSWLTLRSSIGIDRFYNKNTLYDFAYLSDLNTFLVAGGNQQRTRSQLVIEKNEISRWVWDNTATFAKRFGVHNLSVMVGTTAEEEKTNNSRGLALDVPSNKDQWYLNAGAPGSQTISNDGDKRRRNSYISRLNYGYDNRYLLTATMRADGTSKFSKDNHWGYFPSVGAAWNISNEKFMESNGIFDNLKLRAGWGKVGNDNISSNAYVSVANSSLPYYFNGTRYIAITFDNIIDQNVRWEVTKEYNLGLEFTILKNRLSGEIEYYNKKTEDALANVNLPANTGDDQYLTNVASYENKGVELSLNWNDVINKDWNYSIGGNIGFNKNKTLDLKNGQALFSGDINGFTTYSANGQPIGSFYLLQMDGIFQNEQEIAGSAQPNAVPGDIRYKDLSGPNGIPDGKIDDFDRSFSGAYVPKVTYGLNIGVNYKAFDFSLGGYGTGGGKIYNGKRALRGTDFRDNVETDVVKDRWTLNNPSNTTPRATVGLLPRSTYFLEKGDFFRINNITIGYTLPQSLLRKARINSLRVYVTGQNLFTFTNYSGFTPEILNGGVLDAGIERETYPSVRTYAFGINLGF